MPEAPETPRRTAEAGPDSKSGEAMRASLERKLADAGPEGAEQTPPPVPDHTLLRRIGSGAYGDVWLARNALGTLRAVKVVHRARFKDDRPYEREFHGILKYEPISRTHEGLVQVLHAGRDEARGCFYYVMELADSESEQVGKWESGKVGYQAAPPVSPAHFPTFSPANYSPRTLHSDLARQQRLPPVEAAQFVLRLAGALGHLHAHGLVHRDIKPSNVIFVGGQPKLADIGLVTDVCSSHSFVGTEGFIPPEGPGTPQADIYGLGKLLYELATGALWFVKNEERHAKDQARNADDRARAEAKSREKETELRRRAESAERETQHQLYTALLEQARATVLSGELGQRVRALDAIRRAAVTASIVTRSFAPRPLPARYSRSSSSHSAESPLGGAEMPSKL